MNNKKMLLSYLQGCVNEGKKIKNNLSESPQTENKPSGLAAAGSLMQTIVNTMQNTPGYEQARKKLEDDQKAKAEKVRLDAEVGKAAAKVSSAPPETNRPGIDVPHKWKSTALDQDTNISAQESGALTLGGIGAIGGSVVGGPMGGIVGGALGSAIGTGVGTLATKAADWWDSKQQEHNAERFREEDKRNYWARFIGGELIANTQSKIQAQQKAQKSAERERAQRLGLPWTDEFGIVHNA